MTQLEPCAVACVVRDRLQAEAADLRVALRVARIGTWRRDLVTDALVWSAELHALFGTDAAYYRPTAEGALLLVHLDDRAMVRSCYARAIVGEEADYEFEIRGAKIPRGAKIDVALEFDRRACRRKFLMQLRQHTARLDMAFAREEQCVAETPVERWL